MQTSLITILVVAVTAPSEAADLEWVGVSDDGKGFVLASGKPFTPWGFNYDHDGLGCYHKKAVPRWYDGLGEAERWKAQAAFWEAVAKTCAESPAVFCYDLMNEPVVIEETFPLKCSTDEMARFIDESKSVASGWISFY